jgi:superfamily II DNA helicase RecQ
MSPDRPPHHILVTIEHSESIPFRQFVDRIVSLRHLSLAVVDEAHLAVTHDCFRTVMDTLKWLGSIPCQILLLSATVGPSLVEELFAKFGITQYVVCRERTSRPNISYNVIRTPTPTSTLDAKFLAVMVQPGSHKAIIFCRSREDAESTGQRLGLSFCHGHMSREEINAVLKKLRSGQVRAVVSTPVLGVALDIPDLRWVFHLDYPYDMLSYIQESGRSGRQTGSPAFSYVIVPVYSVPRILMPDRFGAKLIYDWANNTKICRRWLMQLFNDGVAEPCSMMVGIAHLCDVCHAAQSVRPEHGVSSTPSSDLIRQYLPFKRSQ